MGSLAFLGLFFGSTRVCTQGLTLVRQALLLFELPHQPFICFFEIGSLELFF
jgi:hypothetical protein